VGHPVASQRTTLKDLPYLSQAQADGLREFLLKEARTAGLPPQKAVDLAVRTVAQFPVRVPRGH
jgi:hypothetical protein